MLPFRLDWALSGENTASEQLLSNEALTYLPRLTLTQICSVKLLTTLWNQKRNQDELQADGNMNFSRTWSTLLSKIGSDLKCLTIPKSIYYNLLSINKHVSESLEQWIIEMNSIFKRTTTPRHIAQTYLHHVIWTPYGKVSQKATARSLLTVDELSADHKFIIACNYCLEPEVYELAPKVLCNDFLKSEQLTFKNFPMVYYWIAVITDNYSELNIRINKFNRTRNVHFNVIKFLFHVCTTNPFSNILKHESANEYLWNKLNIQEKMQNAVFGVRFSNSLELTFRLIHSLDLEHRRKVLSRDYMHVLTKLMVHGLWGEEFFTALDLFSDLLTLNDFLELCNVALGEMKRCGDKLYMYRYYEHVYTDLWHNIPDRVNTEMYSSATSIAKTLKTIPWNTDLATVRKIMSKIDESLKKNIITSEIGRALAVNFAQRNEWIFYDLYSTSLLPNKQDLFDYKKSLIEEKGLDLAVHFIRSRGWDNEREFFECFFTPANESNDHNTKFFLRFFINNEHWDLLDIYTAIALPDKQKLYELKRSLVKEEGLLFGERIVQNRGLDAEKDFLRWYFETESKSTFVNERMLRAYFVAKIRGAVSIENCSLMTYFLNWSIDPVRDLHTTLLDDEHLALLRYTIYTTFLPNLRLVQADKVLKWYFSHDSDRIDNFKKMFILNSAYDWITFTLNLLKQDPEMHLLRNFKKWCFPCGDTKEFTDRLLWSNIWWKLLSEANFELADNFINWCFDSCQDKVDQFKNHAMVGFEANYVFDAYLISEVAYNEEKLKRALKWFNPSITTVDVFKSVFTKNKHNRIHELLAEMVKHPDDFL